MLASIHAIRISVDIASFTCYFSCHVCQFPPRWLSAVLPVFIGASRVRAVCLILTRVSVPSALHEAESGADNEEETAKSTAAAEGKPAPTAAEITKDLNVGQELADQSGIVLTALQSLSDSIVEQNADAFNAATKEAVTALQGLTTALQKAVKTENVRDLFKFVTLDSF